MNINAFIDVLPVMGMGMLGVFFVIAVIWISISLMVKLFK